MSAPSLLRGALLVAGKDLRIELRTKEIVVTTGLFAALVAVIASLSFYVDRVTAPRLAPGVLWTAIAFSGVLALGRSFAREREGDAMRALLLSPVPRGSIYLGKMLGTLLFVVAVELGLVPLVALLFHVDLVAVGGPLAVFVFTGTLGLVAAGALFGALTVETRARDLVLSIVLFPLVAPAMLAAVVATRELFGGAPFAETAGWLQVIGLFDVAFVGAGLILFEPLTSE